VQLGRNTWKEFEKKGLVEPISRHCNAAFSAQADAGTQVNTHDVRTVFDNETQTQAKADARAAVEAKKQAIIDAKEEKERTKYDRKDDPDDFSQMPANRPVPDQSRFQPDEVPPGHHIERVHDPVVGDVDVLVPDEEPQVPAWAMKGK
jgi:hypothetical protein